MDYSQLGILGEIIRAEETPCPGVCVLDIAPAPEAFLGKSLYIVEAEKENISERAKGLGKPVPGRPELLQFPLEGDIGAGAIVRYELQKYYVMHDLPEANLSEVRDSAALGAELYPAYFGEIPAPYITPRGYTTRSLRLVNGAFWLETDRGAQLFAMTRVLWENDLQEQVRPLAVFNDFEQAEKSMMGYAFFEGDAAALALFDLMQTNLNLQDCPQIRLYALTNVVWRVWPEYTAAFNAEEAARTARGFAEGNPIKPRPRMGEQFIIF